LHSLSDKIATNPRRTGLATEKFMAAGQNGEGTQGPPLVANENASTHASQPGLLGVTILLVLPFLSR